MVSTGGSNGNRLHKFALGGLALLSFAVFLAWAIFYLSPWSPEVPSHRPSQAPGGHYQPGGSGCDPDKIARFRPGAKSVAKRDHCAAEAEEHRQQQEAIAQATRSADIAEREMQIAQAQAKSGFVQTIATILAFGAAVAAAVYAYRAVVEAERGANAAVNTLHNERAWLLVGGKAEAEDIEAGEWNGSPFSGTRFKVPVMNFGKTPSRGVFLLADQEFILANGPCCISRIDIKNQPTPFGVTAPGGIACKIIAYIDNDSMALMRRHRDACMFLFFRIFYKDIFQEEERILQGCFRIYWDGFIENREGRHDNWGLEIIDHFGAAT